MTNQPTHKQNPETPPMTDTSDNISDKSLIGDEPKPCPFCDGQAYSQPPALGQSGWQVVCDDCGAKGPFVGRKDADEANAVAAWNSRTTGRQALRADITARYENTLRSLDDAVKVEQCDREAAADYMRVIRDNRWSQHGILRGFCDNCSIVIAFARHRIAAVRAAALADLAALDGETM